MSEQDQLSGKFANVNFKPSIQMGPGDPNANPNAGLMQSIDDSLSFGKQQIAADEEAAQQQTASVVETKEMSDLGNNIIKTLNEQSTTTRDTIKLISSIEKRNADVSTATTEKVVEGLTNLANKPREIDLTDKREPEEKSFMDKVKDSVASSCGIAKTVLFDAGKGLIKPLASGVVNFVSTPVGAGVAAGVGVAAVGAGVAAIASANAPGMVNPKWLNGVNKSKMSNEKLAGIISKYWKKHGGPDDPTKLSWFIGSVAGESGFESKRENGNYSAEGIAKHFSPKLRHGYTPAQLAKNPQKLFNVVYANRNGNGSIESGDGYKYRGGGIIQLTGKGNYEKVAKVMGLSGAEELESKITDTETAIEASIVFFLKNPCAPSQIPVKATSFQGALSRVGNIKTGLEKRQAAQKQFMDNVKAFPNTTPDYNNGMKTENGGGSSENTGSDAVSPVIANAFKEFQGWKYASARNGTQKNRTKTGWADCSSLVGRMIKSITNGQLNWVSDNTSSLVTKGDAVSAKDVKPGDMVFWPGPNGRTGHVEMYAGGGKTVGTNDYRKLARWRDLNEGGRQKKITAVRRVKKVYNIING